MENINKGVNLNYYASYFRKYLNKYKNKLSTLFAYRSFQEYGSIFLLKEDIAFYDQLIKTDSELFDKMYSKPVESNTISDKLRAISLLSYLDQMTSNIRKFRDEKLEKEYITEDGYDSYNYHKNYFLEYIITLINKITKNEEVDTSTIISELSESKGLEEMEYLAELVYHEFELVNVGDPVFVGTHIGVSLDKWHNFVCSEELMKRIIKELHLPANEYLLNLPQRKLDEFVDYFRICSQKHLGELTETTTEEDDEEEIIDIYTKRYIKPS